MADALRSRADPLRTLRAFAQVARLGSVSRAAEALGLSQPALSLQLQALSRQHGIDLLQRNGRRLVPTEAGEALLALARPLVDGIDGLDQALRARLDARSPDGLSVAAGSNALERLLPPAIAAWAGEAPPLLRHAGGDPALDLLRDGSVAIAVGSWLDVPGDIVFLPLLESPARLLVPSAHPLARLERPAMSDLAGHALVLPRDRRSTRQLVDLAYGRAGLPMVVAREAGDWPAVRQLVALGQGIAISTALAADAGDARIAVRPLPGVFPARPYGIATRRGRTPGPAVQAFIDALRDVAGSIRENLGAAA